MKNNKSMMIKKKLGLLTTAIIMSSSGYASFDEGAAVLYATAEIHFVYDNLPLSYTESYFVDLGITGQDLVNAAPVTVHDAGLGAWLNTRPYAQWSVISTVNDTDRVDGYFHPIPVLNANLSSYSNSGIVGTSYTGSAVGYDGHTNEQQKFFINDWISDIKASSYGSSSFAVLGTDQASADASRNGTGFNNSMIAIGSLASLFYVQADPTYGASLYDNVITSQVGTAGTLSQSAAYLSADGTFKVNVKAVPIPAAAWMFGSALVGLALARRK